MGSFDLGGWHLIGLNSNCARRGRLRRGLGRRGSGSPRTWPRIPGVCTLAYWHHPRFSSGPHGDDAITADFWTLLYAAGADLVARRPRPRLRALRAAVAGRRRRLRPGIREFVVGTGGKNLTSVSTVRANSEVRNYGAFGVLELTLWPNGYDWRFVGTGRLDARFGPGPLPLRAARDGRGFPHRRPLPAGGHADLLAAGGRRAARLPGGGSLRHSGGRAGVGGERHRGQTRPRPEPS